MVSKMWTLARKELHLDQHLESICAKFKIVNQNSDTFLGPC